MDSIKRSSMPPVHDIIITHFVNPNEFWYKKETNTINETLYDLELGIQAYFLNQQREAGFNISYIPKTNEMVAVFTIADNRWLRAKVDYIFEFRNDDNKYILWAIDYGKPIMSTTKYIRKLPEPFVNFEFDAVYFGGINNILPAEKTFDFMENSSKTTITNKWSEKAINICEEIINRSYTCTFRSENYHNRQNFGQLEITTDMNKQLNIKNVLIEINDGMEIQNEKEFYQMLNEYQINKSPRWLQPNGNCKLLNFDTSKNLQQRSMPSCNMLNLNELERTQNQQNPSLEQQQKLYSTRKLVNNQSVDNEISVENQATIDEKMKFWNKRNAQETCSNDLLNKRNLQETCSNDLIYNYDDIDSISIVGACGGGILDNLQKLNITNDKISQSDEKIEKEQLNISKDENYREDYLGRPHLMVNKNEKIKFSQPPRDNDSTIVPAFQLAVNKTICENIPKLTSTAAATSTDEDKKSTVSIGSDVSSKKLKYIEAMKKRVMSIKEQQKVINIPAGYDLRNLNLKRNNIHNTSSSTSSNEMANKSVSQNYQQFNNNDINVGQPGRSERTISNNHNEQQKLSNSAMNYQAASKSHISNDAVQNYRNRQERVKADNTLHKVNEVCIPTCEIGKQSVLVHGTIPKPINKIAEANFTSDIHTEMERKGITKIYRIQQYAWPHLARFNSLILINSRRTGKTFSYLPIICSLINMQKDDGEIPNGVGPIGLIIVPYRSEADNIIEILRRSRNFTEKNILCSGERNKVMAIGDLQNNADLLICTPEGIDLLMKSKLKCFSKNRLKHLIIEDFNLWNDKNREILKDAFKKFHSYVQIIVTSQIWDPEMEKLLTSKSLKNTLLCIGAPIEAAVYAKTNFKLKIMKKDKKIGTILEFINKHDYQNERLIIICNNDDDVLEVSKHLKNVGHFTESCTNNLESQDISQIIANWNNPNYDKFILITSDESLPQLHIQNAQNLIHYTLSTSWTRTCYRFTVFLKYYSDRIKETTKTNQPPANTLILLDEDNNDQLPKLVNFMERNNSPIHPSIKKAAKNIEIEREMIKNCQNTPLCAKWLEFDKIHNQNKCNKRHLITYTDAPQKNLPNKGYAEIQIISCESPIHYCVRLFKHKFNRNDNWEITRQSNEYVNFNFQLTTYFSNSDNHQLYYPIVYNDLCAIKVHERYDRGKIIERDAKKKTVFVKLIDRGQIKAFREDQLLYLPDQFKEFPAQAVDLYLADVIPYDEEEETCYKKPTETIKKWLEKYAKKNNHRILAYINFTLADIIYADEIIIQEYLESLKSYNYTLCLKKNIIEKEFVKSVDLADSEIRVSAKKMFHRPEIKVKETVETLNNLASSDNISNEKSSLEADRKVLKINDNSHISSSNNSLSSSGEIAMQMLNSPNSTGQRGKRYSRQLPENSTPVQNIEETRTKTLNNKKLNCQPIEKEIKEESWEMLTENEFSKISIGWFITPNDLYIQNLHDVKRLDSLYKKINDFITNGAECVQNPEIGANYLAKFDENYNRCKITSLTYDSNGMFASVFFCDIGSIRSCKINELRTTNSEITNSVPYQAIGCTLIGIKPKNIGEYWTDQDSDDIYNLIDQTSLYARPILNAKQNNDNILKYWKYEIILIDCSTEIDIQYNKEIINKGYAIKDPNTSHYLDIDYNERHNSGTENNGNFDYDTEEEWEDNPNAKPYTYNSEPNKNIQFDNNNNSIDNDYEINFTKDELAAFFNLPPDCELLQSYNDKPIKENKSLQPITENSKNVKNNSLNIKKKFDNMKEMVQNDIEEIKVADELQLKELDMPKLISIYKIPQVIWQQSDILICLRVSAPDIEDYYLNITNSNLQFAAIIDGEVNVLNLNLFGCIDPTIVSHEIRGLNVIIRLFKKITGKRFAWPRLTQETDKHNWLKYNYETIIMEHEKYENSVVQKPFMNHESSDTDSEFAETIDYETYNQIENPEDVYDVLGDI